jgi:hypothetical protein
MPLTLLDCKNYLQTVFPVNNQQLTLALEKQGKEIVGIITDHSSGPTNNDLDLVSRFLIGVELWKADCDGDQTGNAARNSPQSIWTALKGAIYSSEDLEKLLSIMQLCGFGSSRDEESGKRRAKRATAVLRFLDPELWGVVDWRVAAIIGLYENKCNRDIESSINLGKNFCVADMAGPYDILDEKAAEFYEKLFRSISMKTPELPKAVDVERAFYGASFMAWPRQSKSKSHRINRRRF